MQPRKDSIAVTSPQAQAFLDSLGDDWLERNRKDIGKKTDDVEDLIERLGLKPQAILELGCSNGWRLNKLHKKYSCAILGIDPSTAAIAEAEANAVNHPSFLVGTADKIPVANETFDIVILGFCMWCIPPEDWFSVVAETTRVLKEGGFIIIHDYTTPRPYRRLYSRDREGQRPLFTYAFDWPSLWLAHSGYKQLGERLRIAPKQWETIRTTSWEITCAIQKNFIDTAGLLNE